MNPLHCYHQAATTRFLCVFLEPRRAVECELEDRGKVGYVPLLAHHTIRVSSFMQDKGGRIFGPGMVKIRLLAICRAGSG